jgi:hypothetical protein
VIIFSFVAFVITFLCCEYINIVKDRYYLEQWFSSWVSVAMCGPPDSLVVATIRFYHVNSLQKHTCKQVQQYIFTLTNLKKISPKNHWLELLRTTDLEIC